MNGQMLHGDGAVRRHGEGMAGKDELLGQIFGRPGDIPAGAMIQTSCPRRSSWPTRLET